MADVAHTVPTSVAYLDGSQFGLVRPGIQVTPFISGRMLTRDWHGHNIVEYELTPALFNASDDTLEEWATFWHQIDGGATAGYIVEPISGTHRDLLCGGLGDASKTTFQIPVFAPTSVTGFVDGVPQAAAAYTIHSVANLYLDAPAACEDADYTAPTNATDADAVGVALDGLGSVKVTPAGGAIPYLRPTTKATGLSAAEEYTAIVALHCTKTSAQAYRVRLMWYESDDSYISATASGDTTIGAADGWTVLSVTGTSPALTAKAHSDVYRNDATGTDPFYVDCFAVCPGDYTRWHLPSVAPGLIEFAAAPAAGTRITATATGKRVTRCRFSPGTRWSMSSPGHAAVRSIHATEWIEF